MPTILIQNELEEVRSQFHNWRKNHPHQHSPKRLWQRALALLAVHDLKDVAKATGYPPSYLRRKMKGESFRPPVRVEPQFVEVQMQPQKPLPDFSSEREIKLHLKQPKGTTAELSFRGAPTEVFSLLTDLFKEDGACCR